MQGKAEDAGGLTPAKDDNAAMRTLYPRAFARNSDDCYRYWAGRNSRGVTQYDGEALEAIVEDFDSGIDYIAAQDFISECFCT